MIRVLAAAGQGGRDDHDSHNPVSDSYRSFGGLHVLGSLEPDEGIVPPPEFDPDAAYDLDSSRRPVLDARVAATGRIGPPPYETPASRNHARFGHGQEIFAVIVLSECGAGALWWRWLRALRSSKQGRAGLA
jgi:hypothetical protein